jgi:hypothetical protein
LNARPSVRRGILLAVVWSFVVCAAAYDSYFAWREQRTIEFWEMNPVARWTVEALGFETLIGFKAAGIAYGFGLAIFCYWRHDKLGRRLTMAAGSAYVLLTAYYVFCHLAGPPESDVLGSEIVQARVVAPEPKSGP